MDFAVPIGHWVKLKESENKDNFFDLNKEVKKLWNMEAKAVPIVIGALGTVTRGLIQGHEELKLKGQVATIQTTTLLRSAKILRRVIKF